MWDCHSSRDRSGWLQRRQSVCGPVYTCYLPLVRTWNLRAALRSMCRLAQALSSRGLRGSLLPAWGVWRVWATGQRAQHWVQFQNCTFLPEARDGASSLVPVPLWKAPVGPPCTDPNPALLATPCWHRQPGLSSTSPLVAK